MLRCFAALGAGLLLASCASDVANRYYAAQRYPAKQPKDVQILRGAPSRPYNVIAEFQARGETANGMQRRAAQIGADAVILTPLGGNFPLNSDWAGDARQGTSYSRLVGTAVKYK